jgi:hypothetical protein
MTFRPSLVAATVTVAMSLATPVWADPFFLSTGSPDGRLGALSQPTNSGKLETETADDFILPETTSITEATIVGLIPLGTSLANISNVEVEIYRVFPSDSDVGRTSGPPTFSTPAVPTRVNSPGDVEVDTATRDGRQGTLVFRAIVLSPSFSVANTVITGIKKKPNNVTFGEGSAIGEQVQITISFNPPILLPVDHYFFRPEVLVTGGTFLYLSAPRPIVSPGTPFLGDLQAWVRNSDLNPDWLRIGTDIIDGSPAPTFNMTFSLRGETIPEIGTPGEANCHGQSVSAVARQFRGISAAASALGFSSVKALQDALKTFCKE